MQCHVLAQYSERNILRQNTLDSLVTMDICRLDRNNNHYLTQTFSRTHNKCSACGCKIRSVSGICLTEESYSSKVINFFYIVGITDKTSRSELAFVGTYRTQSIYIC